MQVNIQDRSYCYKPRMSVGYDVLNAMWGLSAQVFVRCSYGITYGWAESGQLLWLRRKLGHFELVGYKIGFMISPFRMVTGFLIASDANKQTWSEPDRVKELLKWSCFWFLSQLSQPQPFHSPPPWQVLLWAGRALGLVAGQEGWRPAYFRSTARGKKHLLSSKNI